MASSVPISRVGEAAGPIRAGEQVPVTRSGKVVAFITPVDLAEGALEEPKRDPLFRVAGTLKGKITVPDDFNDPVPGFEV